MRWLALIAVAATLASGQNYRCDWGVVGFGAGELTGDYRCGATLGQTAAGQMAGMQFLAHIGFWQAVSDTTGIRDAEAPGRPERLVTRLEAIAPNPCPGRAKVRYSLGAAGPVSLVVHDLAGRQVRVLVGGVRQSGHHAVEWRGEDDAGRRLGNGVYFCRLRAGQTQVTRRLVVAR